MDRLVKPDSKEVELLFYKGQKCSSTFKLTNLMHTMSVAVSLTTTNSSIFSLNKSLSIIPPLSSSSYTLQLSHFSDQPPLTSPADVIIVRATMLPTGKARHDDLRRIFSKPGPHVFRDAVLPISLVGPHVADFLISHHGNNPIPESCNLYKKVLSGCDKTHLIKLLKLAVELGHVDPVAVLIDAGADASFKDSNGKSLIPFAIRSGKFDVVKLLVASCCRIKNSVDLVLHEAAAMNRIDFMKFLIESFGDNEIDVNSVDPNGRNSIHVAAIQGHVEVIEFCVSIGGDPNYMDKKGWTPLHYASSQGHLKTVECLLECSNVKKVRNKDKKTAFLLAKENGHTHLFDLLHWGDELVHGVKLDDVDRVKKCIEEGAELNRKDQNGWTALHWAAFKGRMKSLKVLLEHGAEVDAIDGDGYTPLHSAAHAGHLQVVLLLIAYGSQVNLKSFQGTLDCVRKHVSLDYNTLYQEKA
ncbi:hypothetical protein Lal_00011946 [Lupinus albus]|uniref:Putative immunoglobulin-like, ankyrin repeat-containing domain-containing protein n=1 Tax=Lupinus albus TaxID=3870 RepID=A0A6A4QE43_LUPAL|nr:putative immunoglobulin-like, ankyrin repeat-containing domain-containing protein [Lupinus albus]KAF1880886.1 hypothetical protein Lal_00011946 [Lupinus albus]